MELGNWINAGIILALFSAATYYYGRLSLEARVVLSDKFLHRLSGLFFVFGHILLPFVVVYYKWWLFSYIYGFFYWIFSSPISTGIWIFFLFTLSGGTAFFATYEIERKKDIFRKLDFGNVDAVSDVKKGEVKRKKVIGLVLVFLSFLFVSPLAILLSVEPINVPLFLIHTGISFLGTTITAIFTGAIKATYFPAKVVFHDARGESAYLKGMLIRYGDPIILLKIKDLEGYKEYRKKYIVPVDNVLYIESEEENVSLIKAVQSLMRLLKADDNQKENDTKP